MPNIVLFDGEDTPVAHTFEQTVYNGQNVVYHDRAGGVVLGYPKLVIAHVNGGGSVAQNPNRIMQYTCKIELPILREVGVGGTTSAGYTPGPELSHRNLFEGRFKISALSSEQERDNLVTMAKNLFADATFAAAITDLRLPSAS